MSLLSNTGFVESATGSAYPLYIPMMSQAPTETAPANLGLTLSALANLRRLKENWDGFGSRAPIEGAVKSAESWVRVISNRVASLDKGWIRPHVSANEDGHVVLEWWYGERKLTIYVAPRGQAKYIKVWGADIENEMEDGAMSEDDARPVWQWLASN